MQFSAIVLGLAVGSTSAFVPSARPSISRCFLSSTTEGIESEAAAVAVTVESPVTEKADIAVVDMAVMKDTSVESSMDVDMPISAAPEKSRIQPGRYNDRENSIALPFMMRPRALDGSHAGDYGFDPLGFTEDYDLYTMQESELRHARLAMLAVVGWPLSELVAPDWMLQDGRAPSVLNGFNPVSFVATVAVFGALGYFEFKTSLRRVNDQEFGKIHSEDMADIWSWGVAGDYNFDPLQLYSSIGNDSYARKGLRDLEVSHGRSAMLGITGFAAWEALTGHPIIENSMFFHPNPLLPAVIAAYFAFNWFYEREESDQFIRFKLSSEGEARMENLKLGAKDESAEPVDFTEIAEKASGFISGLGSSYEKAQQAYLDNIVKVDEKKD